MYIRIGNDITVGIPVGSFNVQDVNDIVYTKGRFVALDATRNNCSGHLCTPQFYDSDYTIHDYIVPHYSTPHMSDCGCACSHGFCVYLDYSSPVRMNEENTLIMLHFPGVEQKAFGRYTIEVEYKVKGQKQSNLLTFNKMFELVHGDDEDVDPVHIVCSNGGQQGDTFINAMALEEVEEIGDRWSLFMLSSKRFVLNDIGSKLIDITVSGGTDKIVILSKYDDLYFSYNGFMFPVSRTQVAEGWWLYVSSYFYPQLIIPLGVTRKSGIVYDEPEIDTPGDEPVTPPDKPVDNTSQTPSSDESSSSASEGMIIDHTMLTGNSIKISSNVLTVNKLTNNQLS